MLNRRKLITGLISFAAAPAIVKAESLMKVKPIYNEFINDIEVGRNFLSDIYNETMYFTYYKNGQVIFKELSMKEVYKTWPSHQNN